MNNIPKELIPQIEELKSAAKEASRMAYAPYSNFFVGASILVENKDKESRIFKGCNVENASYGLSNCGERTAMFKAVSEGFTKLIAVCVYTPTIKPTPPCGACRQVLNEFGPTVPVIYFSDSEINITTLDKLLPEAFGPNNLK
jgi:cytidine deaminase